MRIAIFGAGGRLGRRLLTRAKALDRIEPYAFGRDPDISDPTAVISALDPLRPAVIVNCSGMTNVDACERDTAGAEAANAAGPAALAEASSSLGSRLIHISTDYVFDGLKGSPYTEADEPRPINNYGRTKLEGEEAVRRILPDAHTILRTAWLYDEGEGFAGRTMMRAREGRRIDVIEGQSGSPTSYDLIVRIILSILDDPPPGTYHAVAGEGAARREIVEEIIGMIGSASELNTVSWADLSLPAPRPPDTRLDNGRIGEIIGFPIPSWRDDLREVLS